MLESPVNSSVLSRTVIPSSISTNLAFPPTSAIMGLVRGSHLARTSPCLILDPAEKFKVVP